MTLDVTKEKLEKAPAFAKNEWPPMSDLQWSQKIHACYGTKPGAQAARGGTEGASRGSRTSGG